ncbi:hypothetical protein NEDG_01170 [Nematocida displodere]|uniref:Uncharacterized protein n=1 Tax=Nematocida displodere TaxID=1805483 RepID=A0A177EBZ6_9MICR|nr:hypothetical protein NEDG_01170 [Nematocida displodere]
MEEYAIVKRFCGLLTEEERDAFFSLLVDYRNKVERLSMLVRRSEEYKLALQLSLSKVQRHYDAVWYWSIISLSFGVVLGLGLTQL